MIPVSPVDAELLWSHSRGEPHLQAAMGYVVQNSDLFHDADGIVEGDGVSHGTKAEPTGPCRRRCAEGRGGGSETAEVVHGRKAVVEAGLVTQLQLPPKKVEPLGGSLTFPGKRLGKVGELHRLTS